MNSERNKTSWVTIPMFSDYTTSYLSPFIAPYCVRNVDNKCVLIIDNAPGHPINVKDCAHNVKVLASQYFLHPPTNGSKCNVHFQGILFMVSHVIPRFSIWQ
jgi:hypothetical protein